MTDQIELAASAKADIRDATRWLAEQASPATAAKWLAGLHKAIGTLASRPIRCPVAAESHEFPVEIRELLYGRRRPNKHRIIFQVIGTTVYDLDVRHTARDEIEP